VARVIEFGILINCFGKNFVLNTWGGEKPHDLLVSYNVVTHSCFHDFRVFFTN